MSDFSAQAAREFLQAHLDDYLADLRALVNIDCGTHNRAGVNRAGEWLAARLAAWGWAVERYPLADYGDAWRGTLRGRGDARLLLLGHLDTVYPDGTAAERPMRIEQNTIYGPGVADMKAGILTGLWAARALQAQDWAGFGELGLLCDSDEEVGSPAGAALIAPLAAAADAVFVLEAARVNGDIVSARKGGGVFTLRVHGRAAHAGVEPEKGANAIVELAHQILAATALNGLRPGVTVNPDVVRGGTKVNVIADFAEAQLDVRAIDPAGMGAVESALRGLPESASVPGTRVELIGGIHAVPMPKTPGNAHLVGLAQAVAAELGFALRDAPITGGTSDANFVAAAGVPVLDGLGPIGGNDHSPDEYLERDSIVPRTALLAGLLARACDELEALRQLRGL
jgi:glutamate carboxypeptidase